MPTEQPRGARWWSDLGGAFGDIGTFLPLALGAIALAGLPAAGVLVAFGIAYALTAWVYRAPIPVQPMKVAAAVLVTATPAPDTVIAAGLVLAAFFLVVGASGAVERLARLIPGAVTAALQIGLGASLAWLALTRLAETPVFAAALLGLLALLLLLRPGWPVAIILLVAGVAGGHALGLVPTGPLPPPAPTLPALHWPAAGAFLEGTLSIALPQIPLTLTNAILVTVAVGRDYFPHARRLDATRLALTTAATNLVAAPLAGMPLCHGAGGVAAHHRFGARTWRAPALLAVLLLGLGLGWGEAAAPLLARVPDAALGALLLVPALDLVRAARPMAFAGTDRAVVTAGAVLAFWSPGIAFLAACAVIFALRRWRMRPQRTESNRE